MLEEAQKTIPEELSERFSMNRFFAQIRDVVNDELQDNVPFLIEDALENPTGTYKQISRFQNEKLADIDRSNIRIEEKLDNILGLIGKMKGGTGDSDSWWDDLFDMLGMGALGRGLFGGKGKKTKGGAEPKTKKGSKPKKPPGKLDRLKRIGGKVRTGGRYAAMAAVAAIVANYVYDMSSDEYSTEEAIDSLLNGDYGNLAEDIAAYTAIGAAPIAAVKLKSMLGSSVKPPTVPSATPTGSAGQVRRKDLPKDHPKYKAVGGPKDKFGTAGTYVSAAEATNYKSTATPKAPTTAPSVGGKFDKAASGVLSGAARNATSKATGLTAAAYALYDFYKGVTSLDPNLTEEQYTLEVSKLGSAAVAEVGLFMFSAFVSSLIAGTYGAIAGGTAGGVAGAAAGGVGAAPGAAAGAATGGVMAAIASFVFDLGVYYTIDYFWGEELDEAAKNEEFNKLVAKVVYWLMTGYKTLKQGMQSVSEFVSGDTSTDNTGFRAKHLASKSNPTAKKATASPAAAKAGASMSSVFDASTPSTEQSSLDWLSPGNMLKAMASSPAFGGAAGGSAMAGVLGLGSQASAAFDQLGGEGALTASSILGPEALAGMMGMIGAKAITPEEAEMLGISPEDAAGFNASLNPQTASNHLATQTSITDATREMKPQLAKTDTTEELINEMRQRDKQYAEAASAGNRQSPTHPAITIKGFPQAASTPHPTSLAVVALRAQGMADVYAHPQSGATMERMDRGGETLLG